MAAPTLLAYGAQASTMSATTQGDERSAVLRELLAFNRTKHPRYRGGLANHLPMALCSQYSLGASSARLKEFATSYGAMLDPMPVGGRPVDPKDWKRPLGHENALNGFVKFFEGELRERGREAALRDALEALAPSLSCDAFHCLIRTAFGVRFDDDLEIAHGLAYWAITSSSLGAIEKVEQREKEPALLVERIRGDAQLGKASISGSSIIGRMRQATGLPGFAQVAGALEVDEHTQARLAKETLAWFACTGNFTALHAVTATHALRVLLPFSGDAELLLRYHWQALAAAFIGIGAPRTRELPVGAAPNWSAIQARAVASADDHDAKLVFACREEQALHDADAYRYASALRMKLVS